MTAYIIQVVMFQLMFLLVYETLLKKETFFTWNRMYLLVTAIVSLLLPLIKIEALSIFAPAESFSAMTTEWLPEVIIGNTPQTIEHLPAVEISAQSSGINWWLVLYSLGFFGSILLVFKKYKNLERLFRFKTVSAEKDWRIIEIPNSTIACTFYRTIFLGDRLTEAERQQILSHELVHVKQKHSLDLVFFEILKIIFWFNPLIYIYQNRIATLHEFIADAAVVKHTEKRNYYEQLLNSAFNTRNISFINQFFNHSLIKKRITMIQRSKSKTIAKIKYLVIVPLLLVMLTFVACSDRLMPASESNLEEYNYTLVKGEEKSSEKAAKRYEAFLAENPDYVGWRIVDHENETVEYSIHSKDEKVPADFKGYISILPGGEESMRYVKEIRPEVNTIVKNNTGFADVPFAVVEEVPIYPGCEDLSSNVEKKDCMTENVSKYVTTNFNTALGKQLDLEGVIRIIAVFKINAEGKVTEVRARAPHPDLEAEAIRVISSLPEMTPGKHTGKEIGVSYSLPIVFQVNKQESK